MDLSVFGKWPFRFSDGDRNRCCPNKQGEGSPCRSQVHSLTRSPHCTPGAGKALVHGRLQHAGCQHPFPRPCPSTLPRNKMLFYFMEVTLSSSQTSRGEAVLFYGPALNATA